MITPGVRALVWLDLRDQVRDRKAMFARALPVLLLLVGMAFGVATAATGDSAQQDLRRVVVTNDIAEATGLVALGRVHGVDVRLDTDPVGAVASGEAEAGVRTHAGSLEVLHRPGSADSALTARRVQVALVAGSDGTRAVIIEAVEADVSKLREGLAAVLPPLLLGLLGVAFGSCAAQFQSARRSGTLAHQLTLPLPRTQLLLAKTLTEAILTGLALSPFVVLVLGGVALTVAASLGGAAAVGAVAIASLLIASVLAASALAGLLVAARSARQAAVQGIGFAPMGIALALTLYYTIAEHGIPTALVAVPVIGLVDVLRRAMLEGPDLPLALAASASVVAALIVLVRAGAAAASTDDLGMRVQ